MSYYNPSYSQTIAMSRGRGFSSSRGTSYRGSSRGNSNWSSGRGGYSSSPRGGAPGRFSSSFSNSFDSRSKYSAPEKYGSRHSDDYRKSSYKESNYSVRERSPERKRMRTGSSHDRSFGGSGDYNSRYESERRSFSGDRRPAPFTRREEFRKPLPPSSSPRGGYRGRISSRGSLRARLRDRPARRRLIESSYNVRRRILTGRSSDYRRLKVARLRSSIIRRMKREETGSDKEESETEKETVEKTEVKEEPTEEAGEGEAAATEQVPDKKEKKEDEAEETEVKKEEGEDKESPKKTFIKLTCPHCLSRCATFGKYSMHLQSGRHASAMRKVAMKQKALLSQMRLIQRKAQRELEKTTEDLAPRTSWCPLCKLNYKQPKSTHQGSQAHKEMKKFLMPTCKICKITFKSPMVYESHVASIEHIKRKATTQNGEKEDEGSEDDVLENFMTIDSVGDMDGEEGETAEKKEGEETKPKEKINVGIEKIRKVEVHYCDLCRMYLPRSSDEEEMNRIISRHCRQRTHLTRYIRFKEDKELTKRAERLMLKDSAEKEKEVKEEVKEEVGEEGTGEEKPKEDEAGTTEDEKMWEDVDKDLGIILAEAGSGNKSSDEDEEDSVVNGERYDRFKLSEKVDEQPVEKLEEEKKEEEVTEAEK